MRPAPRNNIFYILTNDNKGVILIIVLWALFLLSALLLAINSYVWPQLGLSGRLTDRAEAYYLARAAVERAALELKNDETDACDSLNDSWSSNEDVFKNAELGDGVFCVTGRRPTSEPAGLKGVFSSSQNTDDVLYGLIDEERKINVNKAPQHILKSLFEMIGGAGSSEAETIAACVLDWCDADETPRKNGAENIYYLSLYPSYRCENKGFDVLEKLLLIKGMTPLIFDRIKDKITIYGSGSVNINTADNQVLCILGMSEGLTGKIVHFRKGEDGKEGTEDDNIFTEVGAIVSELSGQESISAEDEAAINSLIGEQLLGVASSNFMGCATGYVKNKTKSSNIVFIYNRSGDRMEYWRE